MSYMKLIKLLYLIDRESLSRRGTTVSGDVFFSMKNGPVLSGVLDLINDDPEPSSLSYWASKISNPTSSREVNLISPPEMDSISEAEFEIANMIFEKFGHMSRWQIRDYTHTLPEWHSIDHGRVRIMEADILRALGKDAATAEEDALENKSINWVHAVAGVR